MNDYLIEENEYLNDKVDELEDKFEQIKNILGKDVYLGTIGNCIKYEILEVIESKEDDKQLKLKGF